MLIDQRCRLLRPVSAREMPRGMDLSTQDPRTVKMIEQGTCHWIKTPPAV